MSDFARLSAMPTQDAFRALASEWHDMTESGCCSDGQRFCGSSENWARGYLAAVADAEAARIAHTCNGHPNDRCDACWQAKHHVFAWVSHDERSDGRCNADGGAGIGAGHVCYCNRALGHPLESDRPHGCSCGAMWSGLGHQPSQEEDAQ